MNKMSPRRRSRLSRNPAFKEKVTPAAMCEDKIMVEFCKEFELDPLQVDDWKRQLLDGAADVFVSAALEEPVELAPSDVKIGRLALENDFFESALTRRGSLSARQ